MSGLTLSRLLLAIGWLATVFGLAVYTVAGAAIVGGLLLMLYGAFGVNVTTPARRKLTRRNSETLEIENQPKSRIIRRGA